MTASVELDYRPSYLAAAVAGSLVLALYVITLGASTAMWDTSEYIAAAYIMGLPHPPGNPFFVILGRFFTLLPIHPDVAGRVNLLAALCSAVSASMWFLVTERVLVSWFSERWQRIVGGSLAALIGATAFTVWSQSVINEKVYTVAMVGVALIAWLTVRWCDDPDGPRADKVLILIAYLLGLGYANHMAGFLAAPAVGLAVLIRRPRTLLRWKLVLACLGTMAIGMTPFATQPIRAAHQPMINEGEPTACVDGISVSCTFSAKTWELFKYNFNREQYGKPPVTERNAPFSVQVGMWWLYFRWQWWRDPYLTTAGQTAQGMLASLFLILGLVGGWVHYQRDRRSFWFFGPLMFTMTLLLIYYLNFKYGASQSPELGEAVDREVRDRDYFYLWSFSAWSVWAALGLVYVWETVAVLFGSEDVQLGKQTIKLPRRRSWLMASPLLLLACVPLVGNWKASNRRGDDTTMSFAHDMLNSVEPYGILVTVGDNDTFPLWYAQEVEGVRRDVVLANTSLMNTDWYNKQLIRNPIREFDATRAPDVYKSGTWTKPTTPPLKMSVAAADSLPLAYPLADTVSFEACGTIRSQIPPTTLTRADILVLQMIKDNCGQRPIYISRTAGGYARELGLEPFMLTQGLARKLVMNIPRAGSDTALIAGEGFVDVPRTLALWNDVFKGQESFIRRDGWVDKPSVGIPALYVQNGFLISDLLQTRGNPADAAKALDQTRKIAESTRIAEYFNFGSTALPPTIPLDSPLSRPLDVRKQ